jgi:hypothetical protein
VGRNYAVFRLIAGKKKKVQEVFCSRTAPYLQYLWGKYHDVAEFTSAKYGLGNDPLK